MGKIKEETIVLQIKIWNLTWSCQVSDIFLNAEYSVCAANNLQQQFITVAKKMKFAQDLQKNKNIFTVKLIYS